MPATIIQQLWNGMMMRESNLHKEGNNHLSPQGGKKMDLDKWLVDITKGVDIQQEEIIGFAKKYGSDAVVKKLCDVTIKTLDNEVRCAILNVLKTQYYKKATDLFADYAANGTDRQRKWAFVNLSLIGCVTKRDLILMGLKDPVASVRRSAALNAGLYNDAVFVEGIVDYFENHRHDFLQELVVRASAKAIQGLKNMKQIKVPKEQYLSSRQLNV